jgi:tetratricopeptide (TPR) repeat protein
MNSENNQVISSFIEEGDLQKEAAAWGPAKISYLKAYEEFNEMREINPDSPLTPEQTEFKKKIESRLEEVNDKLAQMHKEKGDAAFRNKMYQIAIEEYEEATRLAKDDSVKFLEEIKEHLDKARSKRQDSLLHLELTPFVERGDNFRKSGNYGEAVLEYQEAMKKIVNLPADHRFVMYISERLVDCKRSLIRPYLSKIDRACHAGNFVQASSLLKRAQLLLDDDDTIYNAFLEQLSEKLRKNLNEDEAVEVEEFEASEVWESAIKDYEEALDLYSSFSINDPLAPAYSGINVFEDKFLDSRRKLGKLYKNRAEKLKAMGKVEKAIKNYKEAIRLLPRADKAFHDAFREMKKLRAQIAIPSVKK